MDHSHQTASQPPAAPPLSPANPERRPALALVTARFALAAPGEPAPQAWQDGLAALLGWLGIDAAINAPAAAAAAARPRRLPRMADWGLPASPAAAAPVFAPWIGWSPVAFQHGGLPALPPAQFVASYLIDHACGQAGGRGGVDVVLLSPHPAACQPEAAGDVPTPRPAVLHAMIRAARAEGRERIAIILHARQRNAVARQLLAAGKAIGDARPALDILTLEDALPLLIAGAPQWDAIIAMPDLRSTVFTLLGAASGVSRAWPMLWFAPDGTLTRVTSEAAGAGARRLALDAPALIHALALALHEGGASRAAARLHDAWARLRDSGVTTGGTRGANAPYARQVDDTAFIDLLRRDAAVSKRPQALWRALKNAEIAKPGSQLPALRVISSNPAVPSPMKGR